MKRLLVLLLPLVLGACASVHTVEPLRVAVPDLARSQTVQVRDERPASETKRDYFSLLITSDAYGILRNGEMGLEPSPIRLLQHRVFEQGGANSVLVVHHFVTYQNVQRQMRGFAVGAVLGPIGALAGMSMTAHGVEEHVNAVDPTAFEALAGDNEWKRGTASDAENPGKGAAFVTYLDAEYQGKRAFVRLVSPTMIDDDKNNYGNSVDTAIQAWLKMLASGVAALAVAAPVAPAAAAIPAVAAPAPAAPATLASVVGAQSAPVDVLRHLDERTVDGTEWVFPSNDPKLFRNVRLVFRAGKVEASNQRDHTSGTYTVAGDKVCVDLVSRAWGRQCYVVIEATTGDGAHGAQVVALPGGDHLPLIIR